MKTADKPTKKEDADILEGAGESLLEALEGVGTGARQLAGQVIGQAVVVKADEQSTEPGKGPEPVKSSEPVSGPEPGVRVTTRATKSLHQILAERRCRDDERERLEEEEAEDVRGIAQQTLDRYEKEMAAAQLSRKRKTEEEEKEEQEAKRLKRSERHRRRGELVDEQYQKEEEKRRKEKEARAEEERVRKEQDSLLRKAQTLVQREKRRPGKSAVIAVEEGADDMWLPDVVISEKDTEKVTKFRQKKPTTTVAAGGEPPEQEVQEGDEDDDDNDEDEDTTVDMNDPEIIKLAGCAHAKNVKTAAAYEHYMRGVANSIQVEMGQGTEMQKYYRRVIKSMWSVALNLRMYKFIKDADLEAVYKSIPDIACVALRNKMEGKKTGAAKEIQLQTEKVMEVQITREERKRMPVNCMMVNLNELPADRQTEIRLKLTRMYGHQEKAHQEASQACAIFKTLVTEEDIDLNTLRTFAEGTFRPLVAIKIPDVDKLWEAEEAERLRQAKLKADRSRPIDEIVEEQNLPQHPPKGTARPTNDEGKGTRAVQAMVHYFVYGALFDQNPKGITQVAREFDVPVKSFFGLTTGRKYEGGRQAKERQAKEEERLLEISRLQEKGASVRVKTPHRSEQVVGQKKTGAKKKPSSDPTAGTSKEKE